MFIYYVSQLGKFQNHEKLKQVTLLKLSKALKFMCAKISTFTVINTVTFPVGLFSIGSTWCHMDITWVLHEYQMHTTWVSHC